MSNHMHYLRLGASLYVPATHADIAGVATAEKYPQLRSVIFDTEDSIADDALSFAYDNLQQMLHRLKDSQSRVPMIFIRVRNEFEIPMVLDLKGIELINGLVLPKFCCSNMEQYMMIDIGDKFYMPVLERDVFTTEALHHIRDFLLTYRDKVLSLRIGANDMLSSMGMRRDPTMTIYDIRVIELAIANIVLTFKPCGFNITGPVWESFSQKSKDKLQQEAALDLANGLFGKTVIHPWQVEIVEEVYKVDREEHAAALKILSPDSPPVFKMFDRFHEKATHSNWARVIIERARIYGLRD
ncbi:MAG: HpcH/HpaI aldolase/citrate lyase family protein [Nitrospirae bacterium]|uniref:HpcH/HpaI aldolase/citrate lyase family protein n=1 Tax=Candidatus Magnetobacterium casense TaxID=1455061 RepID=UPI00058C23E4|nr:HpcH/HpaI aldolase/citrate lyase family protein [Candidatus Magnetobacterium casensis]MBF0337697.1 HpcH/HpaI aldolase/citrate lyase family protein [Nitrospirota bacterium]